MGTSIIDVSGTWVADGTFTLNDGGGLMLGDPYGITLATTGATGGNIRVLGTRTFSSLADYTYYGNVAQVTGDGLPGTVRNFTVDNSQGVTLTNNLIITGVLGMSDGNIITNGHDFFLSGNTPASLNYSSGTIVGSFERNIAQTGQDYLFPVGSATRTQSLTVNFGNLTSGSLLVSFVQGDPGDSGLPLSDGGSYTITDQYTTGYWVTQAKNSLSTSNFDIDLDATGFGPYPVTAGTRVLRRNGSASWSVDGIHAGVSGSVVSRSGMTQTISNGVNGTHFCIGKTGPLIISQPTNGTICEGTTIPSVFSVTASGYGTISYQWYKAPGEQLVNDGHFTGTNTSSLGIINATLGDAGMYYCIITDGRGETIETNHVMLNVPSASFGYNYYSDLTISQASGSENLYDFPLLVTLTRNFLRSSTNGGHVISPNGFDIAFLDNNNQKLNHEVES
ncbi:immunoglobulin domain-containing protein, partial [bacterium]|nr:immunoglobulin domain-containing protein [bacterium]